MSIMRKCFTNNTNVQNKISTKKLRLIEQFTPPPLGEAFDKDFILRIP